MVWYFKLFLLSSKFRLEFILKSFNKHLSNDTLHDLVAVFIFSPTPEILILLLIKTFAKFFALSFGKRVLQLCVKFQVHSNHTAEK